MPLLNRETRNRLLFPQSREKEVIRAHDMLQKQNSLNKTQLIEAWAILAEESKWRKQSDDCKKAYLRCANIIQTLNDTVLLGECYTDLGDALYYCADHSTALTYYQKAVDVFQSIGRIEVLTHLYSQMAYCSSDFGRPQQERDYLIQALELPIDQLIKATFVERIALSYNKSRNYETAAKYYEEALLIFENQGFKRSWEERVDNLTQIYLSLGDEDSAKKTEQRK